MGMFQRPEDCDRTLRGVEPPVGTTSEARISQIAGTSSGFVHFPDGAKSRRVDIMANYAKPIWATRLPVSRRLHRLVQLALGLKLGGFLLASRCIASPDLSSEYQIGETLSTPKCGATQSVGAGASCSGSFRREGHVRDYNRVPSGKGRRSGVSIAT
jgi:hypothetical protein